MQNNYFSHDEQYCYQIRRGAMGSPLTLTTANFYMFFFMNNQLYDKLVTLVAYTFDILIKI